MAGTRRPCDAGWRWCGWWRQGLIILLATSLSSSSSPFSFSYSSLSSPSPYLSNSSLSSSFSLSSPSFSSSSSSSSPFSFSSPSISSSSSSSSSFASSSFPTSSSSGSFSSNRAPISTLVSLVTRFMQNLPSLKLALVSPRSMGAQGWRGGFGFSEDTRGNQAPAVQCFDDLGCLTTGEDFYHPQYRPINVRPESREVVSVTFKISTRDAPQGFLVPAQDVSRMLNSTFKADRPTKFVIHGYLNGRDMPWLEEIVKALLEVGDYNVVYVDWTGGSLGLYTNAVANARLAALEIANLLHFLSNHTGMLAKDVHLIGHSLGAHLSGYVGEQVAGLGRITGLDPAEPFFQYMPPSVRLDPSDALLVDVIHSDAGDFTISGGYGLSQAVGHLDFYPNGGINQPGCKPPFSAPFRWLNERRNFSNLWNAVEDAVGCNHIRAVELFLDSIRSQCPFVAFRCSSFSSFNRGECFSCGKDGSGCVPMGLYADSWQTAPSSAGHQLYITTGPKHQLCVYHFHAVLEVGDAGGAMGHLQLEVVTLEGNTANFDLTNRYARQFQPGKSHTFLLQHSEDLSTARAAHLTWTCPSHHTCPTGPSFTKLTMLNIEMLIQRRHGRQSALGASQLTFCANDKSSSRYRMTQVLSPCHDTPATATQQLFVR